MVLRASKESVGEQACAHFQSCCQPVTNRLTIYSPHKKLNFSLPHRNTLKRLIVTNPISQKNTKSIKFPRKSPTMLKSSLQTDFLQIFGIQFLTRIMKALTTRLARLPKPVDLLMNLSKTSPRRNSVTSSPRVDMSQSQQIDTSSLAEEKRRIARDIVLERAQIRPLQERFKELTRLTMNRQVPEGPSKTPEDEERKYRLGRLEQANKEKAELDAELAKIKPMYCDAYADQLRREIDYARDLLEENSEAIQHVEEAIEERERQLDAILNSEAYLEAEQQRAKIDDMNKELNRLIQAERDAMKAHSVVFDDDPETDELRKRLIVLQQCYKDLAAKRNQKQEECRRIQLERKSRRIVMNKIARMASQKSMSGTASRRPSDGDVPREENVAEHRKLTKENLVAQSMRMPEMSQWERSPRKLRKINSESMVDDNNDPRCSRRSTRPIEEEGMRSYFAMELAMKKNREELEMVHGQGEPEQLDLNEAPAVVTSSPEFELADEVTDAKESSRRRMADSALAKFPSRPTDP